MRWLPLLLVACEIPVTREHFEPPVAKRLIDKEGVIVFWVRSSPVRAEQGGDLHMADHVDLDLAVKNERSKPAVFSTREARLTTQGNTFSNALPIEIELAPGETRSIQIRYAADFDQHPEFLQRGTAVRMFVATVDGMDLVFDVVLMGQP